MKVSRLIVFGFLLSLNFIFAQSEPKAEELVKEVLENVKNNKNLSVEFSYVLENIKEQIKEQTRGEIYIEGDKYRLNLMGNTQIFDGQKIYSISPEDEEINISSIENQDKSVITPSKMLTFFEEGYNYKWDINQNLNGREIQYIKLIPIDTNADYKNILLGVDKHTKNIFNLIYSQNNGTRTEIKITSFKPNQPLTENIFKFDKSKYPDFYINELD